MFGNTCSSLEVEAREFKPITGGDYRLTMRFVSTPEEKIYGMGQYQQPYLDVKGADLELAHRNSQASVPFMLSSLGYGFLWNNPAVGRVNFGKNITTWEAFSSKKLDYWITAGDTPAEIEEAYANATGKVPMMPEYAMGFWQCKLRYQTQEELLEVAREYKHMTFYEAAHLAKEADVKQMWLTHYSPSLVRAEEFMGKVKSIFPRAKAGKDGKTITLDFQEE